MTVAADINVLKKQLVFFSLGKHLVALSGAQLRGVFGRDERHWILFIAVQCEQRTFTIIRLACREHAITVGVNDIDPV